MVARTAARWLRIEVPLLGKGAFPTTAEHAAGCAHSRPSGSCRSTTPLRVTQQNAAGGSGGFAAPWTPLPLELFDARRHRRPVVVSAPEVVVAQT